MDERALEIKVGILVTICGSLLLAFILLLGDFSTGDTSSLFIAVDNSGDLKAGAPVKVAGVHAGRVTDVSFKADGVNAKGEPRRVLIELELEPEMLASVHQDAAYYITTEGVLGEKYVEISPGAPNLPTVEPGSTVEGEPPLRLEEMALNANRLLSSLARIVRDNEAEIGEIIRNTGSAVKSFERTAATIDSLITDKREELESFIDNASDLSVDTKDLVKSLRHAVEDGEALRKTIHNAEDISSQLKTQVGPIVGDVRKTLAGYAKLAAIGSETLGNIKGKLESLVSDASEAVKNVLSVAQRVEKGVGTVGALLSDTELYDDVREMVKDLKRHPWKFIWKE